MLLSRLMSSASGQRCCGRLYTVNCTILAGESLLVHCSICIVPMVKRPQHYNPDPGNKCNRRKKGHSLQKSKRRWKCLRMYYGSCRGKEVPKKFCSSSQSNHPNPASCAVRLAGSLSNAFTIRLNSRIPSPGGCCRGIVIRWSWQSVFKTLVTIFSIHLRINFPDW